MRKLFISLLMASSVTASFAQQSLLTGEITDNLYVGVNLGLNTNLAGNRVFPLNTTLGIRAGKDITPVFGLNVEASVWFGSNTDRGRNYYDGTRLGFDRFDSYPMISGNNIVQSGGHNLFRATNLGINGTVNISNLLNGYLGEPQKIEYIAQVGIGWGHVFSPSSSRKMGNCDRNILTAKTGVDIAYNFGDEKEHQLYLEPAILWNLGKDGHSGSQFNRHYGYFSVSVGYNYKFGCSYGGHNFKFGRDCDLELARLNALLEDCKRNPKVVEKVVERVVESAPRTISIDNLKVVPFEQGKWDITDDAKTDLNTIKAGARVQIIGTASPEGSPEWNQTLSLNRANAVAAYLESRGVIVESIEGRGVEGKTSNRLAIVYVL